MTVAIVVALIHNERLCADRLESDGLVAPATRVTVRNCENATSLFCVLFSIFGLSLTARRRRAMTSSSARRRCCRRRATTCALARRPNAYETFVCLFVVVVCCRVFVSETFVHAQDNSQALRATEVSVVIVYYRVIMSCFERQIDDDCLVSSLGRSTT